MYHQPLIIENKIDIKENKYLLILVELLTLSLFILSFHNNERIVESTSIISLRGNIWVHETSLTPPNFQRSACTNTGK